MPTPSPVRARCPAMDRGHCQLYGYGDIRSGKNVATLRIVGCPKTVQAMSVSILNGQENTFVPYIAVSNFKRDFVNSSVMSRWTSKAYHTRNGNVNITGKLPVRQAFFNGHVWQSLFSARYSQYTPYSFLCRRFNNNPFPAGHWNVSVSA